MLSGCSIFLEEELRSIFDLLNPEEIREEINKAKIEFETLTQTQVGDEVAISVYLNNRKRNKSVKFTIRLM